MSKCFDYLGLEGIKNAFNELALGKPLTKEQQKQR